MSDSNAAKHTASLRVSGTTDPAEIAAVLAAVGSARTRMSEPSSYERWRRQRLDAVRASVGTSR